MAKPKQDAAFPTSQAELLKMARGALTQAQFAEALGVDRTCLSKYESEKLGAPVSVISYCLRAIAPREGGPASDESKLRRALWSARQTLSTLEELSEARPASGKATPD